ncbi:SPOR domain-containing protein [Rhodobacteraceae bacterium]|nr:SPOR domain-containing protein [Paracoccaceae bacterium]
MAAINFHEYGDHSRGGSVAGALNWAGAFLSVLLIAGLATWGWKLWVRDVTGVPVVRALEGPMRVAPEEPGGLASNYQGLTVNRIAEERVEAAPSDQVTLAPQPTTMNEDEDLAMADLPPMVEAVTGEAITEVPGGLVTAAPEIGEPLAITDQDLAATAEAEAFAVIEEERGEGLVSVLPDTASNDVILPEAGELSATDLAVQLALGVDDAKPDPSEARLVTASVPFTTPRPVVRPANLRLVSALAPVNGEVEASSIPTGTRLVQLGAYADPDVARVEWENRVARFGDYMVGKERVVQEAETGGQPFYRLRAMGFTDLADARRFCAVLVADGTNCIPVVHQ